jgi:N-carbamoyl-L-amino-acid hydrolase
MTVDLRNTDDAALAEAERLLEEYLDELAESEGVRYETTSLARFRSVAFADELVDLVESTAGRLGYSTRRLPSGAGHDAQMLARICPSAMVFTPSVGGLSHNLAEFTEASDLEAGANVLLHVLLSRLGVVP